MTDPESTPQGGQEPTPATEPKGGQEPTEPAKSESKTFDEAYVKELRAEAAKYRTEAQEAKARAQEYEDANASEIEKSTKRADREKQRADEAEAKLLRYEVAQEKEVPAKLVPLLTATTKEALEAQADLILENAKPSGTPDFDGGAREPAPEPRTPEQQHNDTLLALAGIKPNNT